MGRWWATSMIATAQSVSQGAVYERVVIVTRKTQLEELTARFNTVAQARFYLEHAQQDFAPVEAEHASYHEVLDGVRRLLPRSVKQHVIEREMLPQYTFGEADLVVTVGQDGLVVNTAKYLRHQPILAINPDPRTIDGILLPFTASDVTRVMAQVLDDDRDMQEVTMAQATMNTGQTLLAFNDFFIGPKSHVSARYILSQGSDEEAQSSSGIIVSTGAGSTGWLKSIYAGASGVVEALGGQVIPPANGGRMPWDCEQLIYSVREPFPSRHSQATMVYGDVTSEKPLVVTSQMADNGVIFSDGIEQDFIAFNAGSTVTIGIAPHKIQLVI